jgi:hypothetical protein
MELLMEWVLGIGWILLVIGAGACAPVLLFEILERIG